MTASENYFTVRYCVLLDHGRGVVHQSGRQCCATEDDTA